MNANEDRQHVNNTYYDALSERWYEAWDDPIALLRQETEAKLAWAIPLVVRHGASTILDVGCGAGFVSNGFAKNGFQVTGVDYSKDALEVAQRHAPAGVPPRYVFGDAYALPFADHSFDCVVAFDFLEHVTDPKKVIMEVKRVLQPGGIFLFHTFNRNLLAYLIVIKGVEWFVKNTPPKLHTLDLFIRPSELSRILLDLGFRKPDFCGLRPVLNRGFWNMLKTRVVSPRVQFTSTSSTLLSYCGSSVLIR
jgi:2-polyprenyl-6-hydroxyphenyl methylase / 3-demethylubiquinone-9 3-methyltransferase